MSEKAEKDTILLLQTSNETKIREILKDVDYDSKEWREYNHNHPKRGRAVVVNFYRFHKPEATREGSEKDVERLSAILKDELNFDVDIWETEAVEEKQFLEMVKEEAGNPEHKESDCFLMVLMTHGNKGGKLKAHSTEFELDQVVECFTGDKCEHLIGKPKIFIVQACRGESSQTGKYIAKTVSKGPVPPPPPPPPVMTSLPTHSDIVIAQSQYEGFYSLRSTKKGSYYIQSLCDILERDLKKSEEEKDDLLRLLTLTSHCVAHFEFTEHSTNQSDARDSMHSSSGDSAQGNGLEADTKVFLQPGTVPAPSIQTKLVKQQPTIISTMLKLFYLRNKGAQVKEEDVEAEKK